jgi:hypothetical protein
MRLLRPDWERSSSRLPGDPPRPPVGAQRFPQLTREEVIKLAIFDTDELIDRLSASRMNNDESSTSITRNQLPEGTERIDT